MGPPEVSADGHTGRASRGLSCIRSARGFLSSMDNGKATAIQIQPMSSEGRGTTMSSSGGRPSIPSIPPSANGESPHTGVAPPSDGMTLRQAGGRDARISVPTANSRPVRSVTFRNHFTPPSETRTSDTEPAGWAVNATRKPEPTSGGRVQEDSRIPPGRTCLVSVATPLPLVRHSATREPGRQRRAVGRVWWGEARSCGGAPSVRCREAPAESRVSSPSASTSATEKHGPTS